MLPDGSKTNLPTPWVKILEVTIAYSFADIFRIAKARLQHRRFDGSLSAPITRISFERGDSVGVLLYDRQDDVVILVNQFRYPVYAGLTLEDQSGEGARRAWILEIVAGMVDADCSVTDVANKEMLEEAGFVVKDPLQPISIIYPSPGGTSERISLFMAEVDRRTPAAGGGGVAVEGEDIQIVVLPFRQAMTMIARGEICDAKTIIALQHLALLKA